MEEETTNLVEKCALEMDQMLESVMPDTWMGHARIVLASKDLSDKKKNLVLERTEKLVDENGYPADTVAEKLAAKVE